MDNFIHGVNKIQEIDMNKRTLRLLSLLLAIVIAVGCIAPLTACKKNEDTPPVTNGGNEGGGNEGGGNEGGNEGGEITTASYTVTVESRYGLPLRNVLAVVYDTEDTSTAVGQARTDKDGKASFKLDSSKTYTVKLEGGVPDGYIVGTDGFSFNVAKHAAIKLTSAPISDGDIHDVDMYEVGDVIHDFFITDVYGEEFLISSVLEEKNLLVLNFWYTGCGPCVQEIPYMIQAYESYNNTYGDVVEIFGINDHGESVDTIKNFKVTVYDSEGNGKDRPINFPVFKGEDNGFNFAGAVSKFYRTIDEASGTEVAVWPVSVFIDRAGVICCIEAGGLPNENVWTNTFDHFNKADYRQVLVDSIADFTPIEKPNVTPPSFEEIDEVLTGNYKDSGEKIQVSYRWESNEYSWPFIIETVGDVSAIRPSNVNKDNSYAILYADVYLEAGDALVFDFLSSTQNSSLGTDYMVMIVDGKDIYQIHGLDTLPEEGESGDWRTCCTFVAEKTGTYEVAFVYMKDYSGYAGKDGVFVRNLRVIDKSEIDTETYIFRYAATEKNEFGFGFGAYADVVLGADGYYHVGTADGPLLLAMLVDTYSQFDGKSTVFERLYNNVDDYGDVIFTIDGVDVFQKMEKYGTYAANSRLPGYCPVTEELKGYLIRYTEMFASAAGTRFTENSWLELCCYYDAYGTDGKQFEDPIKGLASFSATDIVLDEMITVEYNTIVNPRGYLYAFTPVADGVYKVVSYSDSTIMGWIFTATSDTGASERIEYACSDNGERISPDLVFNGYKVVCPNCFKDVIYAKRVDADGNEIPVTELSCDDPFCIDADTEKVTVITDFSEKVPVTYIDHNNIAMVNHLKAGVTYYIAVAFHDPNQTGSLDFKMSYVGTTYDKFTYVSPGSFTAEITQSGGFGQTIAGGKKVRLCDRDVCSECTEMAAILNKDEGTRYFHVIEDNGELGSLVFVDFHLSTSIYPANSLKDVIARGMFDFTDSPAKSALDEEALTILETAMQMGRDALFDKWVAENPTLTPDDLSTRWLDYSMFEVMRDNFASLEKLENAEELIATAKEWKAYVEEKSDEWLHSYFGDEYEEKWAYYKMDDVQAGIYHGEAIDYTAKMLEYVDMLLDEEAHPERQGCIAVDAELAHILQLHMDKFTFDGVENSWVKLAYYYDRLGE